MLIFFVVTGRMTTLQVPPTGLEWYLLFVLLKFVVLFQLFLNWLRWVANYSCYIIIKCCEVFSNCSARFVEVFKSNHVGE